MTTPALSTEIVDATVRRRAVQRFGEAGIVLPTFAQLADPTTIPASIQAALAHVDPDAPHPLNLFRVHWYNSADRRGLDPVPAHLVLPPELTCVPAPIVVVLGRRFPMIAAHKVLAAYACLAPRILTGQFDPTAHRAVWPSTGNYCRGGVAISRIMQCRGVAVLPEGMSAERFEWLDRWVSDPSDIVRTPGSESNVKEIYDECARLDAQPDHVIFNQFREFGNHLGHWLCTGRALEHVFTHLRSQGQQRRQWRLRAYASATGSAGTLAAGDYLKEALQAEIMAVEALECPTLLVNGFGEHNIQGIGDKHVPFIHNVHNTDVVAAVSDRSTDALDLLFNHPEGRAYLCERRGLSEEAVASLSSMGLSGIANVLAAIKLARHRGFGPDDVVITVATDGAQMYGSERAKTLSRRFGGRFDRIAAAETFGEHLAGVRTDHLLEATSVDRARMFNLGYFTWVEQQGVPLPEFVERREPAFWRGLRELLPRWDAMIEAFNEETGAGASA
ncbi:pyridoxal-5'-phosphate-dependent protein subunit beta [Paraliomyxa miuraensis]|uniref:pyridoxal-5'-phosphate-dependent protein subunit beta n=1 Tax=Paraliomyxa miuraensis TaxID=376150 RepID=UPI00225B0E61|nr:pyridoxal-5'-phosphate-dependent protein subunit beta [Paraliomyxa miuraensis]MCX4244763.1 pyridoxal-5'-phosphate-dependent protein subunit beta [Paraliomyxa miuraensis]